MTADCRRGIVGSDQEEEEEEDNLILGRRPWWWLVVVMGECVCVSCVCVRWWLAVVMGKEKRNSCRKHTVHS